jgi:diguanylate cyclase (GGDEF)-like protein
VTNGRTFRARQVAGGPNKCNVEAVDRWWRAYLAGGGLVVALYLLVPDGIPRDVAYVAVGLSSVAAMVVGVRHYRPLRPTGWYLMTIGHLTFVTGDILYFWYQDVAHVAAYPSPADALYLVSYPLYIAGFAILIRARKHGADVTGQIDGLIFTIALGLVYWVALVGPAVRNTGQSLTARSVSIAYPVADILLLALLVRLLITPGARTAAFRLLSTAVALLLVADTAFALITAHSSYTSGVVDLAWLGSYVAWGAAALHPSMRVISQHGEEVPVPFTVHRLVALSLAFFIGPCALGVEFLLKAPLDVWAVTACSLALFDLVVARMYMAMEAIWASTRQRDLLQSDLTHQATHDSLTQLANRAYAVETIEAAMYRAQRSESRVGLLSVDLDQFKIINDTLGHGAGDEVLRETARRLRAMVRGGDTAGRLGGDEFIVLIEAPESEAALVELAQRLVTALAAPMRIGDNTVSITASIGVAVGRDGRTDADGLLREADAAMYRAKTEGRNRAEVFDDGLRREMQERTSLEAGIRAALDNHEFVLHYQTIVHVSTRGADGYEALLRWNRPGYGVVMPDDFIPTAELSNLICDIGRFALNEATHQLATWAAARPDRDGHMTVAVNISGRHLANASIVADVTEALRSSHLPPDRLVLEITETVLVDQPTAITRLNALRELGVGISIDDFGTGYTSIGQLSHLSVDSLKIDKSLVESSAPGTRELVRLVVHAAHAFGLSVIAEGVEIESQLGPLERIGCDYAQGYLFTHPESAHTINNQLTEHATPE